MALHVFPAHLFCPGKVKTRIVRSTVSGGTSLSGVEDTLLTDGGGRWEITFSDMSLDGHLINFWEAWNGHLAAGTQDVLVPMLSLDLAPLPQIGRRIMEPSDLTWDDELFPTYVRFAAPYIEAIAAEAAPLRATQIRISMLRGAPVRGGEKFGHEGRGYRIGKRLGPDTWAIEPPLRTAISAGAPLNFDWPVVKCRAVAGEDWSPEVELGQYADTSITFLEWPL